MEGGGSRAVRRSGGTSSPGGEGCVQQREAVWEFSLSGPVLVCWGCDNPGCWSKETRAQKLSNNRHLSLSVLEAGKVQVRVLTDSVSGEGTIPVSSCGGSSEGTLSYKRGMVPFIRMLIHFT